MCVLFCKIFGHKFYIDSFIPDSGYVCAVSGIARDTGATVRKETVYCTRTRKTHGRTRTIAPQTNGAAG